MPRDKDRIPQVGETVYLKNDSKCIAMYLDRISRKGNVDYGNCLWTSYELINDELLSQEHEKEFPLSELTIYPAIK